MNANFKKSELLSQDLDEKDVQNVEMNSILKSIPGSLAVKFSNKVFYKGKLYQNQTQDIRDYDENKS